MIAIIKGDIIHSRKLSSPEKWIIPLKQLLQTWGNTPEHWELVWGDFFQLEVEDPIEALIRAIKIKSLIKSIPPEQSNKQYGLVDVRIAIGIGSKEYTAPRISESNGQAFIFAGEIFAELEENANSLAIKTPWPDFNNEINLYIKLLTLFMDKWSVSSAELIKTVLDNLGATQTELGQILGIKQNSVSGRWKRANVKEMLEVEEMYKTKLKRILKK